jgi:Tol biopolymer transport system component
MAVPFDLDRLELTGESVALVEEVLTHRSYGTAHFALSPDGTLVYVPRLSNAERTLVWVDRTGATREIAETRRAFDDPRLSPDGRRLAVTIHEEGAHIWIYDLARDSFARLTFEPEAGNPVWTPDGERIVFGRGLLSNPHEAP